MLYSPLLHSDSPNLSSGYFVKSSSVPLISVVMMPAGIIAEWEYRVSIHCLLYHILSYPHPMTAANICLFSQEKVKKERNRICYPQVHCIQSVFIYPFPFLFVFLFRSSHLLSLPERENICCQISSHSFCLWDWFFCGLRITSDRILRTCVLNVLNASICFQSRIAKRIRLLSMEMTPEYI